MRVTLNLLRVLEALVRGPDYGLGLARVTGLSNGALYPILAGLEADGHVEATWEDLDERAAGRRRRRYYTLTAAGEALARTELNAAPRFPPRP